MDVYIEIISVIISVFFSAVNNPGTDYKILSVLYVKYEVYEKR